MAATAPILHADQLELATMVGESIALADSIGLLLDADVGGSNTYLTMQTAIATNASTKHAEFQGFVGRLQRAMDYGKALGILSDANVQGVTTLDELIAITPAPAGKVGGPLMIE